VAGGSGMTCHGIRRGNVHHIGILHLVSILTISPHTTCHSAPVCEILSQSDYPQQKKIMSCRFSRWRISAILDASVSEYTWTLSALEALRNALYKFKTYLLTYLLGF